MRVHKNTILHSFLFAILLFTIVYFGKWFLLFLPIIYLLFILKKNNIKILFFLGLFLIPILFFSFVPFSNQISNTNHKGYIYQINQTSLFVKIKTNNYYIMTNQTTEKYNVGDKISFTCKFRKTDKNDSFEIFLKSNRTEYYCYSQNESIIDKNNSLRNHWYSKTIFSDSSYASFSKLLFYKHQDQINESLYKSIQSLGIMPIFVISGVHISFLVNTFSWLIMKLTKKRKFSFLISSIFSLLFVFTIFSPPTALRAFLYSNLIFGFKQSNILIEKNDVLALVGIIFFITNPYMLLTTGMLLSFSITYFINLINKLKIKNIYKLVLINFTAFVISMPLISSFNTEFNLLAPIYNFILNPIISITFILMTILLPFSNLQLFVEPLFHVLEILIINLSNWTILIKVDFYSMYFVFFIWILLSNVLDRLKFKPISYTVNLISIFSISLTLSNLK